MKAGSGSLTAKERRKVRRRERELKDQETIDGLLERLLVGRIATVNRRGFPVIKPVNFLHWEGKIYFHSSRHGEKINDMGRGSRVCFEVDAPIAYLACRESACRASYFYRSILIKGKGKIVKDRERKSEVLRRLMEKYQPEGGYQDMPEVVLKKTAVIEISIDRLTAKENLG